MNQGQTWESLKGTPTAGYFSDFSEHISDQTEGEIPLQVSMCPTDTPTERLQETP